MRKPYVNSIIAVFALTLVGLFASAANESPQTFTLDGQLYAGDRTSPLLDAAAKIKVQILDPSKNCVLYEEEQPVDTTTSGGHFSIQVGSVVGSIKRKAMDAGNTMQKVYQNSSAIAASGVSCSGTYSPVMGAIRYVRVIVTPTAGSPNTLSPDMVMDAVPNAMVAQSVQGLERENILQTNPAVLLTQLKLEQFFQSLTSGAGNGVKFDGTNFVAYDPSNGNNLSPSSVPDTAIGSVGWAKITSVPPALSTIAGLACADGKILKMVSGAWACASESGVGSESDPTVSAFAKNAPGNGLIVNGSSQIVPDFGSTGGKVAQGNDPRFSDSRAPNGSASGDLSGSYPSPTVAKIQGRGVSVAAPADGQVLRYNNSTTQWEPFNFGIGDLKTNAGTPQFISASCTASETLIWSSVTNTFQCTTITINASQVTGTLAIANGGTGQTTAVAALNALLPSQSGANGKVLQSDGTNASWQTPAASGITSFNGSSQTSQSLATPGVTGTSPNWSTNTGTGVHTLNIPMANTASVTAGLISKADYDNFNSKLGSESDPKVGANTTNYLSKWNGSALVASGIVESGGNIGIGTATPGVPFQVQKNQNASTRVDILNGDDSGNAAYAALLVGTTASGGNYGLMSHSGAGYATSGRFTANQTVVAGYDTGGLLVDSIEAQSFATAGAVRMTIGTNGNVGIGSATPATKLDVAGTINATAMTINGVPVSAGTGDNLGNHTATQNLNLGTFKIVGNGGSTGINIDSSGNVGLATTNPLEKLSVVGDAGYFGLLLDNSASDGSTNKWRMGASAPTWASGDNKFILTYESNNSGTSKFTIDGPTGNVGIGMTNPGAKLDVNGTINASAFTVNGTPLTTGGMTSFNGSSQATQTFATPGVTGTAPNWSTNSGTGVHTLNIPMASTASVTAGLISKTDYDNFNSKIGAASSLSGDVTGTPAATVVDKIKGVAVSAAPSSAGQILRYNGSQLQPAFLSMFDLRSTLTGAQAFGGVGCLSNQTLTWTAATDNLACTNISLPAAQITGLAAAETDPKVGANTTNYLSKWNGSALVASGVAESSGNLGLGTATPSAAKLEIVTSGGGSSLRLTDALNSTLTIQHDTSNRIRFLGAGSSRFAFESGGTERLRIEDTGNVGIGTSSPAAKLEVAGGVKISGTGNGITFPDGTTQTTAGGGGGSLTLTKYTSAPFTCDASKDAATALTSRYTMCVCRDGTGWVSVADGMTACIWSGIVLNISPAVSGKTTWSLQNDGPLVLSSQGVWTVTVLSGGAVNVKMWGAGGAGTDYLSGTMSAGGGGGFASGALNASGSYIIRVGQGGNFSGAPSGGGGGVAGGSVHAGGGGYSGLFASAESQAGALLMAGGGGAGGGGGGTYSGGPGGGAAGGAGGATMSGGGGTASAGGAAGQGGQAWGNNGSAMTGGNGSSWGGGGGGGYFGGGGGGHSAGNTGGGGGGSGFAAGSVTSAVLTAGSGATPGNSGDADRGGAAGGGAVSTAGGNGRVIISAAP